MNGRYAVALGLWAMSAPAAASPRRIEASMDAGQLGELLLPAGTVHEWTICDGDCPSGVGSLRVVRPALALAAGAVETRGTVLADVAMLGAVEADVVCAVVPALRAGGLVSAEGRGCRIDRLAGGVPFLIRRAVIAKLEPALGVLLDDQLGAADAFDLLASARDGLLAWYTADAAVRAPAASRCVEAIRSLEVRGGDAPVLVATVDVGCGG